MKVLMNSDGRPVDEHGRVLRFVLKGNNASFKEGCAVCGGYAEACMPVDIFIEGDFQAVCDECQERFTPDLVRVRDHFENLARENKTLGQAANDIPDIPF